MICISEILIVCVIFWNWFQMISSYWNNNLKLGKLIDGYLE